MATYEWEDTEKTTSSDTIIETKSDVEKYSLKKINRQLGRLREKRAFIKNKIDFLVNKKAEIKAELGIDED